MPVRADVEVFAVPLKVTVPLPVPDDPAEIVSQEVELEAVQSQPEAAVTFTDAAPPPFPIDAVVEDTVGEQAPVCVTVKVVPAMVSVPLRDAPVLAAIVKRAVPEPVPAAPAVSVIHAALLWLIHAHDAEDVVTLTLPVPPVLGKDADEAESEALQGAEKAKVFDSSLTADPPGPSAETWTV